MTTDVSSLSGPRFAPSTPTSTTGNASNVVNLRPVERQNTATPGPLDTAKTPQTTVTPDKNGLHNTIEALNEVTQSVKRSLQFSVDEETGITVITVRDSESDEVIRQIPAEEMLKLARRMRELSDEAGGAKGILLSAKA